MSKIEAKELGPMADPGTQLRRARERVGMTLKEVANKSLISAVRLQALENHDFDKVGGVAYVTGYARSYTRIIGVDSEPFVQSFEALLGVDKQQAPPADFNLVRRKALRLPKSILGMLVLAVIVVGFAYFYFIQSGTDTGVSPVESSVITAPTESQPSQARSESVVLENGSVSSVEDPQPTAADTAEVIGEIDTVEEDLALELESRPPLEVAHEGREFGDSVIESDTVNLAEPEDSLTISLRDECWVKVTDAEGKVKIAQIGQSGDNLQLFGPAPFDIVLGNARVADLVFNGDMVTVPIRPGHKTARFSLGASTSNE